MDNFNDDGKESTIDLHGALDDLRCFLNKSKPVSLMYF